MSKKVIFLDIDGTLTTFSGVLPDSSKEALSKANANGHELVICTGRTITQVYPFLLDTGLFRGIVAGAGSDVRRDGTQVARHFIDMEQLRRLVEYLESVHACYFLQCDSGVYGTREVYARSMEILGFDEESREEQEFRFGKISVTENPYAHTDVYKVIFYQADAEIGAIRLACGAYYDVMEGSYGISSKSDGEITVHGYDKSHGMREYLKVCGLTQADTIAFGDGPNDYEMLDFANIGVAMGNGRESLKQQADMVTDDVDADGLYHAFEQLGLI